MCDPAPLNELIHLRNTHGNNRSLALQCSSDVLKRGRFIDSPSNYDSVGLQFCLLFVVRHCSRYSCDCLAQKKWLQFEIVQAEKKRFKYKVVVYV